jgi:competence protein ComEC
MLLGLLHGHGLLERRLQEECVGRMLIIEGTIASLPRRTVMADGTPRQRFEFALKTLGPRQCAGPGRVLLSYYGPDTLIPGEYWWFAVKLKKPWGLANPGSYNIQAWFAQTGTCRAHHRG